LDDSAHDRAFFDTNVLVYAFDTEEPEKQAVAQRLIAETPLIVLSAQVLGEFYWTATRKLSQPLPADSARALVEWFSYMTVVPLDHKLVRSAIFLGNSASIAYWDALIIKAASSAGCRSLLTEDLSHGQVIDGVRIENPFAGLVS
jgi:predicted nucleic acid-binding protein